MKCPACARTLVPMTVADLTVDVCRGGCGGLWFDAAELQKVDEQQEAAGEALLDIPLDPGVRVDGRASRPCPKCAGVRMMRHFFSPKRKVEVDECGGCGGFWLDAGELKTIRSQYASAEERKAAGRAYVRDLFGDQLAAMAAKDQASLERVRRIAGLFRFICPTYYIPGEQSWGAF